MATAPEAPAPPSVEVPAIKSSIEPRRSGRIRNQIQRFEDEVLLLDNDEPTTYKEAMMGPDSVKWLNAIKSEIESMYENQVWNLVDPPEGSKPIECKWIFRSEEHTSELQSRYSISYAVCC